MKLTQEQLSELIAKIYANILEKRKMREENGESFQEEITFEEIQAEIDRIINGEDTNGVSNSDDTDENNENNKKKENSDDEGYDPNTINPEIIEKIVAKIVEGLKVESKEGDSSMKINKSNSGIRRKYTDLFIPRNTASTSSKNDFKSKISTMSTKDRNKMVFGMFGRAVKCIHASEGDMERAAYTAERKFSDIEMAREFKALSVTSPADGGYLVPEVYANEIIELLYPSTVIYSLGARKLGMANGNLNMPKQKVGSRALFAGENRAISKTAPKFGNLKLSAKKLTALIPMSNDLLRSSNFDNDVIVGQDITKQMALGVDWGALLGTGGEFQPLGIANNKNVLNIDTSTLDNYLKDEKGYLTASFPNYLVALVLKNNVYADGLGFVFNTSVEQYFKSIRDKVGGFIFADEMNKNGTLVGYPYKTTNLITNSTDGKTKIIFGNWNDLVIGEQGALEIDTSREGTWTDDSGNLISAFENDQTIIRAINNVDTGLRHDESFAVATKVKLPF